MIRDAVIKSASEPILDACPPAQGQYCRPNDKALTIDDMPAPLNNALRPDFPRSLTDGKQ